MNVGAQFQDVSDMKMSIVLTGTVAEFKALQKNINNTHYNPMSSLNEAINDQVNKAVQKIEEKVIK